MNINNFREYFPYIIIARGTGYYLDKKVTKITSPKKGVYTVDVKSSKKYTVSVKLNSSGNISALTCNCPYGDYCKHEVAALLALEDQFENEISDQSSALTGKLVQEYCKSASLYAESEIPEEEKVHIQADVSLENNNRSLVYTLKIGRDRLYSVTNILHLLQAFNFHETKRYGKELEFTHSYDAIDVNSRRLLEFTYSLYCVSDYYYYDCMKKFRPSGDWIERFFDMHRDGVHIGKNVCPVKFENPKIEINLKQSTNNRFLLSVCDNPVFIGMGTRASFYDEINREFYVADPNFSHTVAPLMNMLERGTEIYISKADSTAFYTAVLKPLSKFAVINGIDLLDDIVPPEMSARFYLDAPETGEICGRLEFWYGDDVYPSFYNQANNLLCDYAGEAVVRAAVLRYFEHNEYDKVRPFFIASEQKIFEFVTSRLSELSKYMEIYASERFSRIKLRPPARPSIGIRPTNNLLELDIAAEGYTQAELIELLGAYRRGSKYHRLKDGSFAALDSGLGELTELAEGLNITDKALLKEKITVPKYRMLYLDSLQTNPDGMRVKRSKDFRNAVKEYSATIEDSESTPVPETLDSLMREYQKQGFHWLRTIASYGFGGILADDMGLGKTLQAIALMLSEKERAKKQVQFLVVCPSSLSLNWINEIEKFAPTLKAAAVTGTVAERNKLFGELDEYDVIITSYATLTRDIAKYEDKRFRLHFIDEAQYIKNHTTQAAKAVKAIKSDIRFALTGTPVENSLAELWSIFDFIMPGYLFGYTYFKKTFESPIAKDSDQKAVSGLQRIVSPFILRRLKKEVLTELPDKTETVLYAEMEDEQRKLYTANTAQIKNELGSGFADQTERIKILAMLTRLRQICCDPSLVYENYSGGSGKLTQCMELIESCVQSGHKILLFSQFTSMMEIIESRLKKAGISYYTLTGKTKPKERIRLVNSFNENEVSIFLISLKAGGTGLNLTGADIVIHYDPWWNVSAENQASDRAYRIGQKNNVQIYKLIAKNTLEEKIRLLQQSKSELFDIAVNGEGDIMKMTAQEVLEILE